MPFGELDPRNHVLDGSGHCRHLVNTSEQFVLGGDVSLCQITLTTCVYLNASDICWKQANGRIVGLAYSYSDNYMFWSDISLVNRGIYRATANSGTLGQVQKIVADGKYRVSEWVSAWICIAHNRQEPLKRWMHYNNII